MLPIGVVSGAWLAVLTAMLLGYGRGGRWGALLVPAATLHLSTATASSAIQTKRLTPRNENDADQSTARCQIAPGLSR